MIGSHLTWPQLSRPACLGLIPLAVVLLVSAGVLCVTYTVFVKPLDDRVVRAQVAYQRAKVSYEKAQTTRTLYERVRTAQQKVDAVWRALPSQDEYASLAMAISELGKSEHVSIPGMSYHVEKVEGGMPIKATLSFKVTGDYGAMYRFLHRLETADSYLVVESLDAARADKTGHDASHLVVFNVTVATFLRPSAPTKEMS